MEEGMEVVVTWKEGPTKVGGVEVLELLNWQQAAGEVLVVVQLQQVVFDAPSMVVGGKEGGGRWWGRQSLQTHHPGPEGKKAETEMR